MNQDCSVKIKLLECEFNEIQNILLKLDINLKNLVNTSIRAALYDINNKGYYMRTDKFSIDKRTKLYSLKIKLNLYKQLQEISNNIDLNIRSLIRDILLIYPKLIYEYKQFILIK